MLRGVAHRDSRPRRGCSLDCCHRCDNTNENITRELRIFAYNAAPVSYACPNGHEWDIEFENGTSGLRTYKVSLLLGHIRESRQMQLVRNGYRLRRTVAVLTENQVRLAAAWVVAVERIRSVQKYDHIGILF